MGMSIGFVFGAQYRAVATPRLAGSTWQVSILPHRMTWNSAA